MFSLAGMPRARRVALAVSACSFVAWSAWELARPAHPFADLSNGRFTDHFSHLNAARLFTRRGLDLWRVPLLRELPRATPAQRAALPRDVVCRDCVFVVDGWRKPVSQNWPDVVRFVPFGNLLLVAPVAALYHFTDLSFTASNRLLIVWFLLWAHLGLFVLLEGILALPGALAASSLLPAVFGVSVLIHWTLEGFYDAVLIAPLLLCWRFLGERRGLAALVAYCAAAFLNFRAFYYAPWALAAAWLIVRDRQWRSFGRRDQAAVGLAAIFAAGSLWPYFLALPGLLAFPHYASPLLVARDHVDPAALAVAGVIALIAIAAFAAARAWIDAATLGFVLFVLTQVRQTSPWYTVALVPWLCAAPRAAPVERGALVWGARALVFCFVALHVHGDDPLPMWLKQVWGVR